MKRYSVTMIIIIRARIIITRYIPANTCTNRSVPLSFLPTTSQYIEVISCRTRCITTRNFSINLYTWLSRLLCNNINNPTIRLRTIKGTRRTTSYFDSFHIIHALTKPAHGISSRFRQLSRNTSSINKN